MERCYSTEEEGCGWLPVRMEIAGVLPTEFGEGWTGGGVVGEWCRRRRRSRVKVSHEVHFHNLG